MLYKYCTTGGFDILLNSRLKAARIEDFNDPFELVFGVNKDNALDTIRKEYDDDGGEHKANYATLLDVDEGRKRVLLIAASILAARKLAQYDSGARIPATVSAIADAVRWAERIMEEIDRRHPTRSVQQQTIR